MDIFTDSNDCKLKDNSFHSYQHCTSTNLFHIKIFPEIWGKNYICCHLLLEVLSIVTTSTYESLGNMKCPLNISCYNICGYLFPWQIVQFNRLPLVISFIASSNANTGESLQ